MKRSGIVRSSFESNRQTSAEYIAKIPKHRLIFDHLRAAISTGEHSPGDRLPSEAELGVQFNASRITVAKAMGELQQLGLVSRRAGAGTFVLSQGVPAGRVFGMLIPDLGRTEIFEPMCQGMMHSPLARAHSFLWGHSMGQARQESDAEKLCQHYIASKVSGVFFAPLEISPHKDAVNRRIVNALDRAGIPIILLDKCFTPYPERSKYDLVGIDNRKVGFILAEHFLKLGATRICFVAKQHTASTIEGRIAGYREAMVRHNIEHKDHLVRRGDPKSEAFVREIVDSDAPEAILCANDVTAIELMQTLGEMGVQVPEDIRVGGIDDVKYASLLYIPLTTVHQNCGDIGAVALSTMLDRLEHPELPARDILLQTKLMVRKSCGSHLGQVRKQESKR
ncbi:MAG: GntR family transcriptional regulator [Acidobacteriaceae bacterium]